MAPLLQVEGLRTYFFTEAGVVRAVDGVTYDVRPGERLGLLGESGSGKTVSALSVLRTVPIPGRIVGGRILFDGGDLLSKTENEMRQIRGARIGMVFQDPNSSLNPVFTVERQLAEIVRHHRGLSREAAFDEVVRLLDLVKIPDPETRSKAYPHELSGGMRQRVAIARAISCAPQLLYADEPTSNLDVTVQAQVLDLIKQLRDKFQMSLVLISHDMGIMAEMTDRITVMYAGQVFETADTRTLFRAPKHPYTGALLETVPRIDRRMQLKPIPGNIPNLIQPPSGCRFHPRCKYATQICKENVPALEEAQPGHLVACHHWRELSLGQPA